MINIFDENVLVRPSLTSEERFVLSRKNGRLRLRVKSPLFENFFRETSGGVVGGVDPLWKVPLYQVGIDPIADKGLAQWGVSFRGVKGLWADRLTRNERVEVPGGRVALRALERAAEPAQTFGGDLYPFTERPIFNISFLLAQGLGEGLDFALDGGIPLSLIEGPSFTYTNTLKNGLFQVMREFIMDYEASVVIQSDIKI